MGKSSSVRLHAAGAAAAVVLLIAHAAQGAVKERVYTMGDNDAGAVVGAAPLPLTNITPNRIGTNDIRDSTTDYGGVDPPLNVNVSRVPLISFSATFAPRYADASDRPGALPGNLGLLFDGINDNMYCSNLSAAVYPFDPRNFAGNFATLAQAWVKPTSTSFTGQQFIFRIGAENGSAKISAGGFWTLQTGNVASPPDVFEVVSSIAVVPNVWTHVAVFRGGNFSLMYVNGSIAALDTGFWGGDGPEVTVGANTIGNDSFFKGVIDNFNIGTPSDGVFNVATDIDYFTDQGITFSGVAGDIDQDGVVDQDDYQIWSQNVGFDNGFGQGDPGTLLMGDADQSGVIDLYDFQIINEAALNPPPPGAGAGGGVPEPTSIVLLLSGLALVSLRRARGLPFRAARLTVVALAGAAVLMSAGPALAVVVVADDFLYDGGSKTLHVGGGFNGYEQYRGGQNGAAGNWVGLWGQIGDGIITTPKYVPPIDPFNGLPEPIAPFHVALYDGFFGVQSELFRDFALAGSVSPTQTLYFGGRFRVDLEIGTDGGTMPQFYAPRLFLNRIFGDDRDTDINGIPIDPQRDRTQDIGLGIQENMVVARLGAAPETMTVVSVAPPDNGNWHTLIGKLELNIDGGNNERLTVWLDPTGVETGGTTAQVQADILPDLTGLIGTLHSQGTVPIDPDDPELGRSYIDDVAIGTAWQDVAQVNVPRLTLRINRADNSGKLINNTSSSFQLNGYSIESAAGSLNGTGWNSLDEQNVSNWQQNLATAKQLVETNFLASTTVAPGGQLSLGGLFTTAATEDLTGRFTTLDGLVNLLQVEYVTVAGVAGDYNQNGVVDAADYTVWRNHLGATFQLQNEGGITPGVVDAADYNFWKSRFGMTSGAGSIQSGAVPEPAAWLLAAIAGTVVGARRRNDGRFAWLRFGSTR